nr:unnamed protein product [Callosobruchus chinensis]
MSRTLDSGTYPL